MKRLFFGLGAAALGLTLIGLATAAFRPDLLPTWARPQAPTTAGQATADSGLQCTEHGVPEKFCTLCHKELADKLMLCKEHGNIPEDICTLCHPEVQKKYNIEMCPEGHGLPKHFCMKCGKGPSASADSLIDDGYCAAIGDPAQADGKPKFCKLLPLVRLASAELGGEIGIQTTQVVEVEHVHELKANSETTYDANRYAEIFPRVGGFLREAHVDLGHRVEAGTVLAVVDSPEVSSTKTQYLTANSTLHLDDDTYRRTKELNAQQIVGSKPLFEAQISLQQAKTNLLNSEQKLRNFRFDDDSLKQIIKSNDTTPALDITTPIKGTVVFRHAVIGEAVEPTAKLYVVADTATMWLWIDVYEKDIALVRAGQPARFTVAGMGGAEDAVFAGKITWVGTELDHVTRTIKVRAELPNPDGLLRANQFGTATIEVGERHKAVTVAKSAVQRYEDADLVFLPQAGHSYRPQRIRTRPGGRADTLEVAWGIKPGQEVVTAGAFLLKTEIMKGSIGAGCCD